MTLERLRWLRDDFSDEIPSEVMSGHGNFKVRRNWWQGVVGYLWLGVRDASFDSKFLPDVERFLSDYTSDEFHRKPLTTEADIARANELINRLLGEERK